MNDAGTRGRRLTRGVVAGFGVGSFTTTSSSALWKRRVDVRLGAGFCGQGVVAGVG